LEVLKLKKDIHPEYKMSRVICSCGETFVTRSTVAELRVEVCSKCHPFYSGVQKFVDSGGRVQRFQRKYGFTVSGEEGEETTKETDTSSEPPTGAEITEEALGAEANNLDAETNKDEDIKADKLTSVTKTTANPKTT
jgi:large subunit ribosomal protein L31